MGLNTEAIAPRRVAIKWGGAVLATRELKKLRIIRAHGQELRSHSGKRGLRRRASTMARRRAAEGALARGSGTELRAFRRGSVLSWPILEVRSALLTEF